MLVNILVVAGIVAWTVITVLLIVRDWRKAKREGTPVACFSCASFKSNTCNHHCQSNVDGMIAAAKKQLADSRNGNRV